MFKSTIYPAAVVFLIFAAVGTAVPATSYYGSYSYPYLNGYGSGYNGYHRDGLYGNSYYGNDYDGDGYDEVSLVSAGGPLVKEYIAPISTSISQSSLYQTHPSSGYYSNGYHGGYNGNGYGNGYYGGYGSYGPHYDKTGYGAYYRK